MPAGQDRGKLGRNPGVQRGLLAGVAAAVLTYRRVHVPVRELIRSRAWLAATSPGA